MCEECGECGCVRGSIGVRGGVCEGECGCARGSVDVWGECGCVRGSVGV